MNVIIKVMRSNTSLAETHHSSCKTENMTHQVFSVGDIDAVGNFVDIKYERRLKYK